MKIFATIAFLYLSSISSGAAAAVECPFEHGPNFLDDVLKAVSRAESCDASVELANACALGVSGDFSTAGAATARCENDFGTTLTPLERTNYLALKEKCRAKYLGHNGTMYVSFAAFCKTRVAQTYSHVYAPAEN